MAIDFKEIPEAHTGSGKQDTFELFARDWLELSLFKIEEAPGRGADGGKDLIVSEERHGLLGKSTVVRWLVSCKHYAHSGKSVGVSDEDSIVDRVRTKSCDGFLGFYSTIASSALLERAKGLNIETVILDGRKLEGTLLSSPAGAAIVKRYFPQSFARWEAEDRRPAQIFSDQENVACRTCGRDLLESPYIGNIIQWMEPDNETVVEVYCTCKNRRCSQGAENRRNKVGWSDTWEDVSDMIIPSVYISRLMGFINELRNGTRYEDSAFDDTKEIYLRLFPHIARSLTAEEQLRVGSLLSIPSWMGGIGSDE